LQVVKYGMYANPVVLEWNVILACYGKNYPSQVIIMLSLYYCI